MIRADDEERSRYAVSLSDDALFVYLRIEPAKEFEAVDETISLLGRFPFYGRVYDPLYETARLPFEVRVAYAGRYGIYYEVLEERAQVVVLFIEDQRRDPLARFSDTEGFCGAGQGPYLSNGDSPNGDRR